MKRVKSINNEMERILKEKDKKIKLSEFKYLVKIIHSDGSVLIFENACVFSHKINDTKLYVVFTEHNRYHWYRGDDVFRINQYEYRAIQNLKKLIN